MSTGVHIYHARARKAMEIIERGLKVKEYELKKRNFSNTGKTCDTSLFYSVKVDNSPSVALPL